MGNTRNYFSDMRTDRHANDDIGGYYHSASGTPDNIVRGRYGSRSPASGQIEETVYTAGPRGWVMLTLFEMQTTEGTLSRYPVNEEEI